MNRSYLFLLAALLVLAYKVYEIFFFGIHVPHDNANLETAYKDSILNFGYSADEIVAQTRKAIANEQALLDMIVLEQHPTFANVVAPQYNGMANGATDQVNTFLFYVSPDRNIRDASAKAIDMLKDHSAEYNMNKNLYNVVHAVHANHSGMSHLDTEDQRLVESMVQEFERGGLMLSLDKQTELKHVNQQLSKLETQFSQNINEQANYALFSHDELDGMSDEFIAGLPMETIDGVAKYTVSTSYPDYFPLMHDAQAESTRKKMYIKFNTCCPDNVGLLAEMVQLRLQKAQLLGYTTFAEYALAPTMAGTPENALSMLNNLKEKLTAAGAQELAELEAIKKDDVASKGLAYQGFHAWDIGYYRTKLLKQKQVINEDPIEEYFPLPQVVSGIFDIFGDMLGLQIVKVEDPAVWHPDVEMYELWEADRPEFIGHFYLDLHPRPGKYNHAACFSLRLGHDLHDGSRVYPAVAMVTNFPAPTSTRPSLLSHSNVKTFMHEFGHVLHDLCMKTKWAGSQELQPDFAETPSNMLENWAWGPTVLKRLGRHYKTGKHIPDKHVSQLVASRNEGAGLGYLGQIAGALFDLEIHNTVDIPSDVIGFYNQMYDEISLVSGSNDTFGLARISHQAIGYASKYYSYLWAKSNSVDMYTARFVQDGIDNQRTGMEYRVEILQPGGTRDALVSMEKFIGRKPNNTAFLKSLGL